MRNYLTGEEKKKAWELHDNIKNHEFRAQPKNYLLEDYGDLIYNGITKLFGGWLEDENGEYRFEDIIHKARWVSWQKEPYDTKENRGCGINVWSNPNIALLNDSIHDFNGIRWWLRGIWKESADPQTYQVLLGKLIETSEIQLMLLHKLLEGVDITTMKFPKDNQLVGSYTEYSYVQNPRFGNLWTREWFNKDEIYKGLEE